MSSSATWVDETTRVREWASFYGPDDEMFGVSHVPVASHVANLVVCSPMLAELVRNYRREVLLARSLAAHGIAVQRFSYRGTGHSGGDSDAVTYASMVEDAEASADRLAAVAGEAPTMFMGTRLAALVAAAASRRRGAGPVIFWEPASDVDRYFKDVFRARMMLGLKESSTARVSKDGLRQQLESQGTIEVAGYPINRAFHDSLLGRTLADELGSEPRPILLLEVTRARRLSPGTAAAVSDLSTRGFEVTSEMVTGQEAWWFAAAGRRRDDASVPSTQLIDATVGWVVAHTREGGTPWQASAS